MNALISRSNCLIVYRIYSSFFLQLNKPVIILIFETTVITAAYNIVIIILSIIAAYDIVVKINIIVVKTI